MELTPGSGAEGTVGITLFVVLRLEVEFRFKSLVTDHGLDSQVIYSLLCKMTMITVLLPAPLPRDCRENQMG